MNIASDRSGGLSDLASGLLLGELQAQIDRCSRCGTCRAHCPAFEAIPHEPYVARGKVQLIRAYLEGRLEFTPAMERIFAQCLLCRSCVRACPNGVRVDELVTVARSIAVEKHGLSLTKRIGLQGILPDNRRQELFARAARFYKTSGISRVIGGLRLLNIFPGRISDKERMLPVPAASSLRAQLAPVIAVERPVARVGYFTGCLTNLVFTSVGRAVIDVLARHRVEVVLPGQNCCGIPALSAGDVETYLRLARSNLRSLLAEPLDAVVVDCGSCGLALKEYPRLLGEEAEGLAGKVHDVSEFVAALGTACPAVSDAPVGDARRIVTYHDPCHLKKGLGVSEAPRQLLKSLPGVEFREMAGADRCCGGAGTYCFSHYDSAQRIVEPKIQAIVESGAEVVATSCPSCTIQLAHSLKVRGYGIQVKHVMEMVSEAAGGK